MSYGGRFGYVRAFSALLDFLRWVFVEESADSSEVIGATISGPVYFLGHSILEYLSTGFLELWCSSLPAFHISKPCLRASFSNTSYQTIVPFISNILSPRPGRREEQRRN